MKPSFNLSRLSEWYGNLSFIVHYHIKTSIKDGQNRANSLTGSTQLGYVIYSIVDISDIGAFVVFKDQFIIKIISRTNRDYVSIFFRFGLYLRPIF